MAVPGELLHVHSAGHHRTDDTNRAGRNMPRPSVVTGRGASRPRGSMSPCLRWRSAPSRSRGEHREDVRGPVGSTPLFLECRCPSVHRVTILTRVASQLETTDRFHPRSSADPLTRRELFDRVGPDDRVLEVLRGRAHIVIERMRVSRCNAPWRSRAPRDDRAAATETAPASPSYTEEGQCSARRGTRR